MSSAIKKRESFLKGKLMDELRKVPNSLAIRHEELVASGFPDISFHFNRTASFWEAKHGTPKFQSQGLQELRCKQLALYSHCRYIIFQEDSSGNNKHILIVHPRNIGTLEPEASCTKYDFLWLVNYVCQSHQEQRNL